MTKKIHVLIIIHTLIFLAIAAISITVLGALIEMGSLRSKVSKVYHESATVADYKVIEPLMVSFDEKRRSLSYGVTLGLLCLVAEALLIIFLFYWRKLEVLKEQEM